MMGHYFKVLRVLSDQTMNRTLNELDLTHAQGQIIGYLSHTNGVPCARDLEAEFGLSHPTVSGLLSRMEAKGFISVRPDAKDRRVKRIYLEEKGASCSKQIHSFIQENDRRMLQGFTAQEEELFRMFLQRAVNNLSEFAQIKCPKREE